MEDRVAVALARALRYLSLQQLPDGEFRVYVAKSIADQLAEDRTPDSTPFVTALIVYSLGFVNTDLAQSMKQKALAFLLREMEGPGLWRYWTSKKPGRRIIPIDLDDTCCVSAVLKHNGIPFPANQSLIAANRSPSGLFYTWLLRRRGVRLPLSAWWVLRWDLLLIPWRRRFWQTTEAAPDDVDGVVNANVLLYLGESEITRPVVDYLIRILVDEKEASCDKWHLKALSFYYMLSRAYFAGAAGLAGAGPMVIERIARAAAASGGYDNPLDMALAVCSLLNLDGPAALIEASIDQLLVRQNENGSWPGHPLYWGGPKKYFGWGSEELTTGLCVEAIVRYQASRA